ncbi:MAG: hypothetical protein ACI8XX_000764 [Polaribacter sp.]|jgi:hypothetical protein
MTMNEKIHPIQNTAKIAGWLYLLLVPLGILGIIYVPATLFVAGDVSSTIKNIVANEMLFRVSILSAFLVQLVNVFVVLFLYKLLKPVNQNHAALMALFILLSVPITFINELFHIALLVLLNNAEPSVELVSLFLELHEHGIFVSHIFWGLWLFPMGYLVFKSGFLPKFLGVLLMIGCVGYLIDSVTHFLLPDFGVTFSEFTFIGELLLPLWLVIKGVDVENWENLAHSNRSIEYAS